jgi:endonuclease/exonuclease/phosphatase family metal-dependent hydrolase
VLARWRSALFLTGFFGSEMKSCFRAVCISILFFGFCTDAFAGTLRIADWNIEADINGHTTARNGFNTVLQGIGNEIINGSAQPIDIMALEETTSNSTTVAPILSMLNADYPGANFQTSTLQGGESDNDPTSGNGPNAIVFNAKSVQLLQSVGVGTPQGEVNGEFRQVMRYEFQPINGTSPFYVYVTHMKSGTSSSDAVDRGEEANIIRNNETTLPANASVLYLGDLNASPPEAEFTNLTADGAGQAFDPLNFSQALANQTDSSTHLRFRDDYQLMTQNILNGTGAINYISSSLRAFGNNGSSGTTVNSSSNTDLNYMTAVAGFNPTQSQILSALTTASDHLPNVADYSFVSIPEPACLSLIVCGMGMFLNHRR